LNLRNGLFMFLKVSLELEPMGEKKALSHKRLKLHLKKLTKKGGTKNNPQNPKRYYPFLCLPHVVHMIAMSQFLLPSIEFFAKLIWIIKTFFKLWTFEVCSLLKYFCWNKGQGLECWCCKEGQLKRQMSHMPLGIKGRLNQA